MLPLTFLQCNKANVKNQSWKLVMSNLSLFDPLYLVLFGLHTTRFPKISVLKRPYGGIASSNAFAAIIILLTNLELLMNWLIIWRLILIFHGHQSDYFYSDLWYWSLTQLVKFILNLWYTWTDSIFHSQNFFVPIFFQVSLLVQPADIIPSTFSSYHLWNRRLSFFLHLVKTSFNWIQNVF